MLAQPAVDGAGRLAELQLRIYRHGREEGGGGGIDEELNKACLS